MVCESCVWRGVVVIVLVLSGQSYCDHGKLFRRQVITDLRWTQRIVLGFHITMCVFGSWFVVRECIMEGKSDPLSGPLSPLDSNPIQSAAGASV